MKKPLYDISQWLQILEEPYKTRAIANWKTSGTKREEVGDFSTALHLAFPWSEADEGDSYWRHVARFPSSVVREEYRYLPLH